MERLFILLFFIGASAGPAHADDFSDALGAAEAHAEFGQTQDALAAISAAREALLRRSGLAIADHRLVSSVSGYARYEPRADARFAPGERLIVYVEPQGYRYGERSDGRRDIAIDGDVTIERPTGQIIAEAEDAYAIEQSVVKPVHELDVSFALDLPAELQAGDYVVTFTLKDRFGGGDAEIAIPIEVVEPSPAAGEIGDGR